jgi:ketosteroid isomerase-like protein
MNSRTLLLKYLDSIGDPDRAAALFAEDGVLELPFLRSLGVQPRYTGRSEIAACLRQLRKLYPDVAFAPNDTTVLIETPDKTLAEYVTHMTAASTGRLLHQLFTGYLVAEAGEIKLLRESFNPLAMAQAQLPNGVVAIGVPSNEVHAF